MSVIEPLVSNPHNTNCNWSLYFVSLLKDWSNNIKSCMCEEPPSHPTLNLSDGSVGSLNCDSLGLIAFGNTTTLLLNFLISYAKIATPNVNTAKSN
jgi:hypothetical protein